MSPHDAMISLRVLLIIVLFSVMTQYGLHHIFFLDGLSLTQKSIFSIYLFLVISSILGPLSRLIPSRHRT